MGSTAGRDADPPPNAARLAKALALVAYLAISVLLFGRGVIGAPTERVIGDGGSDKTIPMWAFEWWPHALARGIDPFSADVVWAPRGMDLSWVAAVPGASYLATPLTLAFGPVATYNVLVLLATATAAWAAFLLGHWVTGSVGPAFVCGLLFGYSSYEIGHSIGHLNLTLVFPIPIAMLLLLMRFAGEVSRRRFVVLLALAISAQFLISTEIFVAAVGLGATCLLLAWWILEREARPVLRTTAAETVGALALTAFVVSPYLVHALLLTGPSWAPTRSPFDATADLANFLAPRRWTWLQPPGSDWIAKRFTANPVESTAYLGLPLLVVLVLFALQRGRPRSHRLLLAMLAVTAFASLGASIRLAGTTVGFGVGQVLSRLPVTQNALPVRLTMFVSLFAALACSIWLAEKGSSVLRWLLALACVVAPLPTLSTDFWTAEVKSSTFFSGGSARQLFDRKDVVLVLPYGKSGWSMLWQAESGFAYRMVGGHLGNLPPEEQRWLPVLRALAGEKKTEGANEMFPSFLQEHEVDAIVVAPGTRHEGRRLVTGLGIEPQRVSDSLVYRLPEAAAPG